MDDPAAIVRVSVRPSIIVRVTTMPPIDSKSLPCYLMLKIGHFRIPISESVVPPITRIGKILSPLFVI
jgi:hypothetical protein